MEKRYRLNEEKLYKLYKIANWGWNPVLCVHPYRDLALRVAKSIAVPLAAGFIVCDVFVTIAWIGLILKGKLPLKAGC